MWLFVIFVLWYAVCAVFGDSICEDCYPHDSFYEDEGHAYCQCWECWDDLHAVWEDEPAHTEDDIRDVEFD